MLYRTIYGILLLFFSYKLLYWFHSNSSLPYSLLINLAHNKLIAYKLVYTSYYLIHSIYKMREHLIHRNCAVCVKLSTE